MVQDHALTSEKPLVGFSGFWTTERSGKTCPRSSDRKARSIGPFNDGSRWEPLKGCWLMLDPWAKNVTSMSGTWTEPFQRPRGVAAELDALRRAKE